MTIIYYDLCLAVPPLILHNDQVDVEGLDKIIHKHAINNIVISPGPGTPRRGNDVGEDVEQLQLQMTA